MCIPKVPPTPHSWPNRLCQASTTSEEAFRGPKLTKEALMQAVVCIERPIEAHLGAYVCIYGHICAYMGHMCVHMRHMCVDVCLQPAIVKPLNPATCWPRTASPLSRICKYSFSVRPIRRKWGGGCTYKGGWGPMCVKIQVRTTKSPMPYIYIYIDIYIYIYICMYVCIP